MDSIRSGPESLRIALLDTGWVVDHGSDTWENQDPSDGFRYTWVAAACHCVRGHAYPARHLAAVPAPNTPGPIPEGPKSRLSLTVPDEVYRRLKVHCSLSGRELGETTAEILFSWLTSYGEGREMFGREGIRGGTP